MENILITEREEGMVAPSGIQRTISVSYRPGIEYFYDYLDFKQYEKIYFNLDKELDQFISETRNNKTFFYRDIAYLRCFRLRIFLYLLNAELLQQAFGQLASKSKVRFYIENNTFDSHVPYLKPILNKVYPDLTSQVSILGKTKIEKYTPSRLSVKDRLKKILWPARVQNKFSQNQKVLIYSDYYRASAIMKKLRGENCIYYTCFPEPGVFFHSLRNGFSFIQNVCTQSEDVRYRKIIEFQKINPVLSAILKNSFKKFPQLRSVAHGFIEHLFQAELPGVLFQIDRASELFEKEKSVQSVLLDEDQSPLKNALCQTAMKFKRTCFVEMHGSLGDKYGYLPLTADFMFVWGEPQKQKLIRWGCDPGRIIVSGCSKYEPYKAKDERSVRYHISKSFGLSSDKPIISFFPYPSMDSCLPYNKMIKDRIEFILNSLGTEKIQLIIKLHPAERNKDFYYSWSARNGVKTKIIVTHNTDPLLLVKASDFLIVHDSTIAMDGFAMGKAVIFFPSLLETVFSNDCVSEFRSYGVFYRPQNAKEFLSILKSLIRNPHLNFTADELKRIRKDCLNEGGRLAEDIMSLHLLKETKIS